MELINGTEHWNKSDSPLYLALGNFDGVHLGHQQIIKSTINQARESGGKSAALILDPHPLKLLKPENKLELLTDIADRAELFTALGLDYLILKPFSYDLASLSAESFVKTILMEKLNISGVVIGYDYSFGRAGQGRAETMKQLGKKLGFTVTIYPMVKANKRAVSSSAIRELLSKGQVKEAAGLLNYYFFRYGCVVRGQGIGKKLLFPTANITVDKRLIWPGKGVYLTAVGNIADRMLFGVTNLGTKPTFNWNNISVETYIFDYDQDIYGRELRLFFLEKLRDTRAFPSLEQLRAQINRDIARARQLINEHYRLYYSTIGRWFQNEGLVLELLEKNR